MLQNLKISNRLKNKQYSLQFLPKCLEEISKEDKFFFKGKNLHTAYIIDIVHNLLLRYYFKKENLFNLSSVILKEKYGYLYNYYMEYLIHINIIYIHKEYKKGSNARVYKLRQHVIDEQISRYKNKNNTLLKKYKNAVSAIDKNDLLNNKILPEIKKKIVSDLFTTSIDYNKSLFYLNHTIQDADSHDRHIFYHFDDYGRVHTNFTILKSFIRKNCLLINGEETAEIDISNSQPLFLSKIIHEEGINIIKHEFYVFSYLVYHGKFYQFIMDNSEIKDKKECKELIYRTFFGRNTVSIRNPFSKLFPSIFNFIADYKNTYGDYRVLAYKLQNLESDFIFNKVIKTLSVINSDINVITIHDSIIVQNKWKQQVQDLMNNMIDNEFEFINRNYQF